MPDAPLLDLVSSFLGPPPASPSTSAQGNVEAGDNCGDRNDDCTSPSHHSIATATPTKARGHQPTHATVIVFSKDRPWQLQQLLRSMKLSNMPLSLGAGDPASITSIDINIIARIDEPFDDGYRMVQDEFERLLETENDNCGGNISLSFLFEDDGACTFERLLKSIINKEKTIEDAKNNNVVMFLTDDCLLLKPIEMVLSCASSALMSSNRPVLGFLSRLHPGISFCQTRNVPCPPPREEMELVAHAREAEATDFGLGAFFFHRKIGVYDWSYPFDLSGGIYRLGDVSAILEWIQKEGNGQQRINQLDYSHPNRLELGGNAALAEAEMAEAPSSKLTSIAKKYTLNAIPTRPFLLILAINRVQDVCTAPIAKAMSGNEDPSLSNGNDEEIEPVALLKYLHEGKELDIGAYRAMHFNSSHIGDVLLSEGKGPPCTQSGGVSVLIPVHEGPREYAAHSMRSIMMQPIDEFDGQSRNCGKLLLSPMQIIIVDDRCTDGSIKAMVDVATLIAESTIGVSLTVRDMRSGTAESMDTKLSHTESAVDITIDIVASEKSGVASALNTGLQICSHEIVARMDADDVSCPGRLLSQIQALRQHPRLNVIGTSSLLFQENTAGSGKRGKGLLKLPHSIHSKDTAVELLRTSLPSSDPGFVAWAILFTCCLSHPTVMFRKSAIHGIQGYDESVSRAEDYDLWNRLLLENPQSIASLPMIGLCHRKHSNSSTSGSNSASQDVEASKISFRAMGALINDKECELLDIGTVTVLKKPNSASSPADLDSAAKLLVKLEHCFIDRHFDRLTDRETALIRLDCDARISELATLCIQKFGRRATEAWDIWCNRCPDKNLERIALICHAAR